MFFKKQTERVTLEEFNLPLNSKRAVRIRPLSKSSLQCGVGKSNYTNNSLLCASVSLVLIGVGFMLFSFCSLHIRKKQPFSTVMPVLVENETDVDSQGTVFEKAAVSASDIRVSEIGRDILKKGGSAVDAAIACMLCSSVVNPFSSGLGGGGFMTVYDRKSKKVTVFNGREVAPINAPADMFVGVNSTSGARTIAVPGELSLMWNAWRKFGKLPWSEVFAPAIELAKRFRCGKMLARILRISEKAGVLKNDRLLSSLFIKEDGSIVSEGDFITNIKLSETFRNLSSNKRPDDLFYRGEIGNMIVTDIQKNGGIIVQEDLEAYNASEEEAISVNYNGFKVHMPNAPSGGPVLALMLNILNQYRFGPDDNRILNMHRIIEAFKFGFGARMSLGDPFMDDGMKEFISRLILPATGYEYMHKVNDTATLEDDSLYLQTGVDDVTETGTNHVSVVDEEGNGVAVTSSVNYIFGSGLSSVELGFPYNNHMDDFSTPGRSNLYGFPASKSNYIESGKRMQSSMTPTVIVDGRGDIKMVLGASGGSKISTTLLTLIVDNLSYNESLRDSIIRKRYHHQLLPRNVTYEAGLDPKTIEQLRSFGHVLAPTDSRFFSFVQAVKRTGVVLEAFSDPRKGGVASGY